MQTAIRKFIPSFLLQIYHYVLAFAGAVVYRFPSRKLTVIGVTGTGGKTTVVTLASSILEEAGHRVATLSSIVFKIADQECENRLKMTMPGRFQIQRFLHEAVKAGCQYAVLEVTSEGIAQHRHRFISFETAVFTNLSPEHIESHGTFEKYRATKLQFFRAVNGVHIINHDDEQANHFEKLPAHKKILFTISLNGTSHEGTLLRAEQIEETTEGLSWKVDGMSFQLPLVGRFNVANAMAALSVGVSQGIELKTCKKALQKVESMPGRMEIVIEKPFLVIVDYAHTPTQLQKVYQTIKQTLVRPSSSMICVLGSCGGGRDKWRRPVLGKLAAEYCREVIVTNEDPYDENPMTIIEQIAQGANGKAKKIEDRKEAIEEALHLAQPNDVVVIMGKGSEPWICVARGKKIPWDDRKIVRELFQKLPVAQGKLPL